MFPWLYSQHERSRENTKPRLLLIKWGKYIYLHWIDRNLFHLLNGQSCTRMYSHWRCCWSWQDGVILPMGSILDRHGAEKHFSEEEATTPEEQTHNGTKNLIVGDETKAELSGHNDHRYRRNGPKFQQSLVGNVWNDSQNVWSKGNATKYWGNVCKRLTVKTLINHLWQTIFYYCGF